MPSPNNSAAVGARRWVWLIGLVITLALLWWSLHDVSLTEVGGHIRAARLGPLLAAVFLATLTFPIRAIRWGVLLETNEGRPAWRSLWHAVAIGFMANNILPARAGEIARAYVGSRLGGFRLTTAFGSLVLERAMDGLVIIGLTALPLLGTDLAAATVGGRPVVPVLRTFGLVFLAGIVFALVLALHPSIAQRLVRRVTGALLSPRWADKIGHVLRGLLEGLSSLRHGRRFVLVFFWSLVLWSVNAASFWVALGAFGIDAPLTAGLLVQGFVAFGVAIPSSPGYFGVFEFATRGALVLYGIAPTLAVSYAVAYHITTFVPITVLGLWSLRQLHLTFSDVTRADGGASA